MAEEELVCSHCGRQVDPGDGRLWMWFGESFDEPEGAICPDCQAEEMKVEAGADEAMMGVDVGFEGPTYPDDLEPMGGAYVASCYSSGMGAEVTFEIDSATEAAYLEKMQRQIDAYLQFIELDEHDRALFLATRLMADAGLDGGDGPMRFEQVD